MIRSSFSRQIASALRCKRIVLSVLLAGFVSGSPLRAQNVGVNEVFVGSELETYLRLLQVDGQSPLYPWSVRSFSPGEIERILPVDSAHPWARRYPLDPDTTAGLRFAWVRPRAQFIYNSGFPEGSSDGALWAGRGVTAALEAGFSARYGPVSLTVAPLAFWAENKPFELIASGSSEGGAFRDGRHPGVIDLPQRFGSQAYARFDPGQSVLRVDLPSVTVGVSTANQGWGPADEYPLLLGANAAGFLNAFVGTSAPVNLGLGRLHGRVVWGRLDQSEYSPVTDEDGRRFMAGWVAVFTPALLSGLELGGARFYHTPWPENGLAWRNFSKPFEGFLKVGLPESGLLEPGDRSDADNQLASVFARWTFPGAGLELFGEFAKEDHNYDFRDLLLEPEHNSAYVLGVRRVWRGNGTRLFSLRGEILNAQISHLAKVRDQNVFYVHSFTRQGHTQRGQLLGSPAAYGGAGAVLAGDLYHPGGRLSVSWSRMVRAERPVYSGAASVMEDGLDVVHSLGLESLFFRGRLDITVGLRGAYEFNRNFGSDAVNLNLQVGGVLRAF